jgi:signal transduction histidine kinase
MKQVLVNLISNAVQAMEGRGGNISLSTRVDGGFVAVRVEDDGPGIPEADLPKVFDPFFSTKDDGTGLGLTMVHRIMDDHDGYIEVTSRVGEGTSFTVYFPVATGSEA